MVRPGMSPVWLLVLSTMVWFLGPATAQPPTPVGSELQVNSFTTSDQGLPQVASDAQGNFVVVWQGEGNQDGSESGVFFQRFDSQGAPQGSELQVNLTTEYWQSFPRVTRDPSGSFVVAWGSRLASDEPYNGHVRRFAADGTPLTGEIAVDPADGQQFVLVASRSDGDFVVAWAGEDGDDAGVQARRFASSGAPQGSSFVANSGTTGAQTPFGLAMDSVGRFVVAWQDGAAGVSNQEVRARLYDSAGTPVGGDIQVNSQTTGQQTIPVVAMGTDGGFVVTFNDDPSGGIDVNARNVRVRRFGSDGSPVGSDFQVNTYGTGVQRNPAVNLEGSGAFVVVWEGEAMGGDGLEIRGQRFASDGSAVGGEFQVNSFTTSNQVLPRVVSTGAGEFVVAWEAVGGTTNPDGSGTSVRAQRFETPVDSPTLTIDSEIGVASGDSVVVPVRLNPDGAQVAGVSFSIDFDEACLAFDPTDGDFDGIPDAIVVQAPADFTATVFFDLGDIDGELDLSIADVAPPVASLVDGTLVDDVLVDVTFTALCTPPVGAPIVAPVLFSNDPAPSFSSPLAASLPGTSVGGSVEIFGGLRGDCSGNGSLDAADLVACGLETFDGDGAVAWDTPDGTFVGNPIGCDANADSAVDAGDLTCKNRLLFGLTCGGTRRGATAPRIVGPRDLRLDDNGHTVAVFELDAAGEVLGALVWSLDLDTLQLDFDPTDNDGDGLPDAVRSFLPAASSLSVTFDPMDTDGELDVIVANYGASPLPLSSGPLFEIELESVGVPDGRVVDGLGVPGEPKASFGTPTGLSVPGELQLIGLPLFTDGFETGDLSAWSSVP